jgi:hypothetical protein
VPTALKEWTERTTAKRRYLWLFGIQTTGVAILLANGVPLFREMTADPSSHVARPEVLVWELTSIVLMQFGYWRSYRLPPPRPKKSHSVLGHIVQFLCRMTFVFGTSVFGFAFITKHSGFTVPGFRSIVTMVALFAFFCYTKEAERLGKILESKIEHPNSATTEAA